MKNQKYVLVRTFSAGVHAGFLVSRKGREVILRDSRRIWYWSGAASLSQLSVDGANDPRNCKFSVIVPLILLLEAIEIIDCSNKAKLMLESCPSWKM